MVGKVLIHHYPYAAYFNGADDDVLEERCTKRWMLPFTKGRFAQPASQECAHHPRLAGDRKEAEAVAASCRIPKVCDSAENVIASVDGLLVLDEGWTHGPRPSSAA